MSEACALCRWPFVWRPLVHPPRQRLTQLKQEAHAMGVEAYVYFYPLLSMDVSPKQFTNGTSDFKGPMNTLVNDARIPASQFQRCRAV